MNQLQAAVDAIEIRKPQVREVLKYPNPMLAKKSAAVIPDTNISYKAVQAILGDLVATMQAYRAVGIAAIQIGIPLQLLAVQNEFQSSIKMVNPRITETKYHSYEPEGCLSFPGTFLRISRPAQITVEYFDENLDKKVLTTGGLLARAIQHEIGHLNGETFLDELSQVERSSALKKMKLKARKQQAFFNKLQNHK